MSAVSPHELLAQITHSLHVYVQSLQASGVEGLPAAPPSLATEGALAQPVSQSDAADAAQSAPAALAAPERSAQLNRPEEEPIAEPVDIEIGRSDRPGAQTETASVAIPTEEPSAMASVHTLEELRAEIGDCQRCRLCEKRNSIVFGVGNPNAEIVFVGEGPGYEEDKQGEPFVGRAGQLLTQIITKGMQMRREDVYIANVVKCRPPENRNPEPDEIAACEPFLLKQLELIKPRVIIALGKFAAQTLLQDTTPITRLRGKWQSYHGIQLMPTLHPAYLLRNPKEKRLVWEDIKAVLREMGRL